MVRLLLKVLIVDDNSAVRELITGILKPFVGEIKECTDGTNALAAYQAKRPDLVFMEIRMPQVDGIQAMKQIIAFDPATRIVIVTNDDDVFAPSSYGSWRLWLCTQGRLAGSGRTPGSAKQLPIPGTELNKR